MKAMALKKQLSVTVVNQAGEGAKLCSMLTEAGINIEAISVCEFTEGGVVRIVVSDDRAAVSLLRKSGYGVLVRVVLALMLDNRPGVLGETLAKLAKHRFNVNYCYGSVAPTAGKAMVVFAVDDAIRADLLFADRS
ncbi:MAG: hypothetical protein NT045_05810 [Candidatus Aureabacteria bacterium]|nr:hypothetical protein [Candidatus Auribacterota bacterium]